LLCLLPFSSQLYSSMCGGRTRSFVWGYLCDSSFSLVTQSPPPLSPPPPPNIPSLCVCLAVAASCPLFSFPPLRVFPKNPASIIAGIPGFFLVFFLIGPAKGRFALSKMRSFQWFTIRFSAADCFRPSALSNGNISGNIIFTAGLFATWVSSWIFPFSLLCQHSIMRRLAEMCVRIPSMQARPLSWIITRIPNLSIQVPVCVFLLLLGLILFFFPPPLL